MHGSAAVSSAISVDSPGGARARFDAYVDEVKTALGRELERWLEPRVQHAHSIGLAPGIAADELWALTRRGGKRVRAALVGVGFEGCGGGGFREVMPALVAVELLQSYLLIHDDWMDQDAERRGGPSAHVALRDHFRSVTEADAVAILTGDLARAFAAQALHETEMAGDRVAAAACALARIEEEVVLGQLSEIPTRREGTVPPIERVYELKTASYTVVGPLVIGATLAGAGASTVAALERFGRPLGTAFQLRDDLLDVFGDPGLTGKPRWSDIRQGKRTALVEMAEEEEKGRLLVDRLVGRRDATDDSVRELARYLEDEGARGRVELRIAELLDEAETALSNVEISDNAREILHGAVAALGDRDR